jgi:dehydrogenase/reductase SDR family protein 12
MKRLHETIVVTRDIEDVFRYTADFSNIEQWDPGVSDSHKLSDGAVGLGSRFRLQVRTGPTTTAMDYVITGFEPPHRVVLEGSGETIHAVDEIRFSEADGATRIDYTAEITLSGLAGLFEPLVDKALDRIGKKAMAGLEDALSAELQAPGSSLARNFMDRLILPGPWASRASATSFDDVRGGPFPSPWQDSGRLSPAPHPGWDASRRRSWPNLAPV